ncbi:putative cleavage and polyadenylation specificity factor subunit 4-like protein [Geospiza fortis]|uniref:Cleavage and polyadenylation specificity factor subunit 4 n=1 Tax=Geospiza fortis TaxID=48883 RepID=A0A8N5F5G6_GEOFO|nr:putative cleavage and polyadenylation specificity factor subunit 4-like protein [Geospiza fortis]
MPILKQLVSNSAHSKRRSRADLTAEMISRGAALKRPDKEFSFADEDDDEIRAGSDRPPRPGGAKPAVCKHWLRGLCKRGDGCDFLHDYDATRMPECYFYSKFGECSTKDCPFLHGGDTASTGGCPWYDRGFCWHGPLCKYKHTRRVMCANYLVGFCPEGPKCKFVHLKAGLMPSSTDPSKGAGCPWGLVQRDLAAAEDRGGEQVPAKEPPARGTQHLWDTRGCPQSPQSLLEGGTCSKRGSATPCASQSRRTQLGMLLGK